MSTTTHPFAPEEIMAFADGELSARHSESISAHIDQCADCRELAASLRGTSQTLSNWTVPPAPAGGEFEERLRAAAANNSARSESLSFKIFQRTRLWTWKHWASGLAIAAAAVFLLNVVGARRPRSPMLAREVDVVSRERTEAARGSTYISLPQESVPLTQAGSAVVTGSGFGNGPMGKPQAREEKAMKEVQDSRQGWIQSGPMIARTVSLSIVVKDFDTTTPDDEWVNVLKNRGKDSKGSFEQVAPLAEAVTLALVALRVPYKRLQWDSAKLEFVNSADATKLVRRQQMRAGWEEIIGEPRAGR